MLIFEASLYAVCEHATGKSAHSGYRDFLQTCEALGLDFLIIRLYAGAWILLISLITVAVDGARLLVYVVRNKSWVEKFIASVFIDTICGRYLCCSNIDYFYRREHSFCLQCKFCSLSTSICKKTVSSLDF